MATLSLSPELDNLDTFLVHSALVHVGCIPKKLFTVPMPKVDKKHEKMHLCLMLAMIADPFSLTYRQQYPKLVQFIQRRTGKRAWIPYFEQHLNKKIQICDGWYVDRTGDMLVGFKWYGDTPLRIRWNSVECTNPTVWTYKEKTLNPGDYTILPRQDWLWLVTSVQSIFIEIVKPSPPPLDDAIKQNLCVLIAMLPKKQRRRLLHYALKTC